MTEVLNPSSFLTFMKEVCDEAGGIIFEKGRVLCEPKYLKIELKAKRAVKSRRIMEIVEGYIMKLGGFKKIENSDFCANGVSCVEIKNGKGSFVIFLTNNSERDSRQVLVGCNFYPF